MTADPHRGSLGRPGRRPRLRIPLCGALAIAIAVTGCSAFPSGENPQSSSFDGMSSVPAPAGGEVSETIAPVDPGEIVEARFGDTAELPGGVVVTVSVTRQDVSATTPGEIDGPAAVAAIRVANGTPSTLDLGSTVVTFEDAAGEPGLATTAGPSDPFTESVEPGNTLDGVYVFNLPGDVTDPVKISVSYAGGAPSALFTGDIS